MSGPGSWWSERVILVTGAGSGIGAATALHLAKLGVTLVLVDRHQPNLSRIALYCSKSHLNGTCAHEPLALHADISLDADVQRVVRETIGKFGRLDVLINNAATMSIGGIRTGGIERFDTDMATNLRGVYNLTQLAVPELIKTKGNIINISSIESHKPTVNSITYSMTKAALDQFTRCLALELAPDGVRVNSVNPGFVRTNMIQHLGLTDEQMDHYVTSMETKIPLRRTTDSTEVAQLIEFLASDKAKSITGVLSIIDGGSSLC